MIQHAAMITTIRSCVSFFMLLNAQRRMRLLYGAIAALEPSYFDQFGTVRRHNRCAISNLFTSIFLYLVIDWHSDKRAKRKTLRHATSKANQLATRAKALRLCESGTRSLRTSCACYTSSLRSPIT